MKTKFFLSVVAAALTAGSAQAGLLVTYNNGTALGLFDENSGAKIRDFSTSLTGANAVTTDNLGNVYVGNGGLITMYDIATGAFLRNLGSTAYTEVRALTFDPTRPLEIITIRNYNGGAEMAYVPTTGTAPLQFSGVISTQYTGLTYYSPQKNVYAPSTQTDPQTQQTGIVEAFSTIPTLQGGFPFTGLARTGLGITGGATSTAFELYYVSTSGNRVNTQIGNQNIITGLNNPIGITNDGTNLYVANFGTDQILAFTTGGAGVNSRSFAVNDPIAVAYTTVPEPSTVAFALIAVPAVLGGRRLSRRLSVSI